MEKEIKLTSAEVRGLALFYAKGDWQYSLVTGGSRLSLADLRGAAKSYSGRYAASRDNLLERLAHSPLPIYEATGKHNYRYLKCVDWVVTVDDLRALANDFGADHPDIKSLCKRFGAEGRYQRYALLDLLPKTKCPTIPSRSEKWNDDANADEINLLNADLNISANDMHRWSYFIAYRSLGYYPEIGFGYYLGDSTPEIVAQYFSAQKNQTLRARISDWADKHMPEWRTKLKLKEIHVDDFGVLCEREDGRKFVKVVNATPEPDGTYRDYWLSVPSNVTRARQAIAWTFGLREEEYSPEIAS